MNAKLKKVLKKRGIEDVRQLSEEEALVFDKWNSVLSGESISVDKIKVFCETQISKIEEQWQVLDNSNTKNERLILLYTVYRNLIKIIVAPDVERENLEKYLTQLLTEK